MWWLIFLLIAAPCNAETFTMPLATIQTTGADIANITDRPEIAKYAESVKRIGNVYVIKWNDYDIEAVSVDYKELKPLGIKKPKAVAGPIVEKTSNPEDNWVKAVKQFVIDLLAGDEDYNANTKYSDSSIADIGCRLGWDVCKETVMFLHNNSSRASYHGTTILSETAVRTGNVVDGLNFLEELKLTESPMVDRGAISKLKQFQDFVSQIASLKEYLEK